MDDTVNALCRLIEQLARATGRSTSTISRLSTGSGATYERLKSQRRITTERANRAIRHISDMWPDHVQWPVDVPRPASQVRSAA